jgi:hypothetical protein
MFRLAFISALLLSLVGLAGCGGGGGCASAIDCVEASGGSQDATTAVSVSIGSGDKIETTAKEIKYAFRYAITVSDALGRPVVGATVTPKVEMVGFFKGQFFRDAELKVIDVGVASATTGGLVGPPEFCVNEDINANFELDAGEDVNGDDSLTPEGASVVATVEGSNRTDSQGVVYFRVEYTKRDASWLVYRLTASAAVAGTEGSITQEQRTSFGVGDDEAESTPFLISRFGVTPGCDNRF